MAPRRDDPSLRPGALGCGEGWNRLPQRGVPSSGGRDVNAVRFGAVCVALGGMLLSACGRLAPGPGASHPGAHLRAVAVASGGAPVPAPSSNSNASAMPEHLSRLDMMTVDVGWAVGASGILRTTDGGSQWRDVTPANVAKLAPSDVREGFLSAEAAWVVAGGGAGLTVYRTADGGATWRSAAIAVPIVPAWFSIAFADAKHGWIMANTGVALQHESVDIFRTTDGGAGWQLVSRTGATGSTPGALPFAGAKYGIAFASPELGWASVETLRPGGGAALYRTTDGGTSWAPQPIPAPPVAGGVIVAYPPRVFSAAVAIAPVQMVVPPAHTGDRGKILWAFDHTRDGGRTWTATPATPRGGISDWISPEDGWTLSGPSLMATVNGGSMWSRVPANVPLSGMRQLDFVSTNVGWALGDLPAGYTAGGRQRWVLLRTADGGRTWHLVTPMVTAP